MMVAVVAGVGAPIEIMEKPESSVKLIGWCWVLSPILLLQQNFVTDEVARRIVSATLVALRWFV